MVSIDGYVDLERIGRGGLGDVYRATRVSTGGAVAIKVLRDVSDQSVTWHRTRRELTALVSLAGHANVIQLLELVDWPLDQPSGSAGGITAPALVMEYAPGGSVAELMLTRAAGLTPAEIVLVGRHTASALVAAHAQGIVHRDVKPQNLLIDGYGQVRLCDFGVAALTRSEEFQAHTNALSMRYASPEDLDQESDVGSPTDVYSLGATLLHLVHGAPPTMKERLAPWVRPEGSDDGVEGALDGLLEACLHPTPSMRPAATDVLERLDELDRSLPGRVRALPVESDEPGSPISPGPAVTSGSSAWPLDADDRTDATLYRAGRGPSPVSGEPTVERVRRGSWLVLGLVAVLLVGAVVGAWWWNGRDGSSDVAEPPVTAPVTTAMTVTTAEPGTSEATGGEPGATVVDRPTGLVPIDEVVWPFGDPGECLVQVAGVSELGPITCAEPHDLQRYAVATLTGPEFGDDAAFDLDAVRTAVAAGCEAAFEPFTGTPFEGRRFDTPFTAPSADTWVNGDRRYQCFIGVDGARLIGDATGVGG